MSGHTPDDDSRLNPGPAEGRLPRGILVLGLVSMLMDISSELIHSLLPVFMASVLGASMMTIGVVEGVAEATAAITKVFSGVISDFVRKRKLLVLIGYGLGAITKPFFPLANTIGWVFAARFVDRIGKGIRNAPRDALIADITPFKLRGAAYGLRQSLDSVGSFLGPLLAVGFMALFAGDIKLVLWIAVLPAFLSVALLAVGVKEPERPVSTTTSRILFNRQSLTRLPFEYWMIVMLGGFFTLSRFSEAFLLLRVQDVGLAIALVPITMIVMNVVYSVFAYPAGILADRVRPGSLLASGLVVLIISDAVLATATTPVVALVGAALWGLHMALTQGLFAKLVADAAPDHLRGTAFGMFNLVSGISLLLASVIAGGLWSQFGPAITFVAGAGFASLALAGLVVYRWRQA
ncbi:MAG: MFS transporter [Marinobacter sp.]|nr:MFS transporter [Marinobacter sp.]